MPVLKDDGPNVSRESSDQAQVINSQSAPGRSVMKKHRPGEVLDLVCVGFGPASLAIAVALEDALKSSAGFERCGQNHDRIPKVAFLERQRRFAWHAGMLLPGAKMQISFIKDLATLRDPKSEFTFLNYLHRQNRLVQFTNLGTFLPLRMEYEAYLRWCAEWFDNIVNYGEEVLSIVPDEQPNQSSKVEVFKVISRNLSDDIISTLRAKHVVIAVGGKPQIPRPLPDNHPRVVHSSRYSKTVPHLFRKDEPPQHIAVVGGGQSAAEIFNDLHSRFPNTKTSLIIKGAALRPSDDSPFVNEIFDPDRVADIYNQDPVVRGEIIAADRGTNYGVVRLELLEHIYSDLYTQRLVHGNVKNWQHRILSNTLVINVEDLNDQHKLRLHFQHLPGSQRNDCPHAQDTLDVDAVFVATGYTRDAHKDMLRAVQHLKPGSSSSNPEAGWTVRRDYRLDLDEDKLSDTLLSILATRGGQMVKSIFGNDILPNPAKQT
ncbi:MAG: hypothetical protein M1825_002262 [Sarcosagium campestre]|nr:MAG: hypothetical protein M1825_002262 [Sarcosagium campestre]